jgi:hypothetical protein
MSDNDLDSSSSTLKGNKEVTQEASFGADKSRKLVDYYNVLSEPIRKVAGGVSLSRDRIVGSLGFIYIIPAIALLFHLEDASIEDLLAYMGDDAFYYYGVAKNLTETGNLSFSLDPAAITNGFQYIWFLVCVVIFGVFDPSTIAFLKTINFLNTGLLAVLCIYAFRYLAIDNQFSPMAALAGSSLFMVSYPMFSSQWNGLEANSYILMLFWASTRISISAPSGQELDVREQVKDAVILILCFLGRTEFILFIGMFFLARLLKFRSLRNIKIELWIVTAFFVVYFLTTYVVFGSFTQSSGLFYSTFVEATSERKEQLFLNFFGHLYPLLSAANGLSILSLVLSSNLYLAYGFVYGRATGTSGFLKTKIIQMMDRYIWVVLYCVIAFAFYAYFQKIHRMRYEFIALVPAVFIVSALVEDAYIAVRGLFGKFASWRFGFHLGVAVQIALVVFITFHGGNAVLMNTNSFKEASTNRNEIHSFMRAGQKLNEIQLEGVGGWNSGALGYFSGSRVVNLDGRVNSEIFAFEKDGVKRVVNDFKSLISYLRHKDIRYIVDGKAVILIDNVPLMYGVSKECVKKAFKFVDILDPSYNKWYYGIALFEVDRNFNPDSCV